MMKTCGGARQPQDVSEEEDVADVELFEGVAAPGPRARAFVVRQARVTAAEGRRCAGSGPHPTEPWWSLGRSPAQRSGLRA